MTFIVKMKSRRHLFLRSLIISILLVIITGPGLCSSINVLTPPTQQATVGYATSLQCFYELETALDDDVIDITWTHIVDRNSLIQIIERNVSKVDGYSLVGELYGDASLGIATVKESDEGLFVCKVVSSVHVVSASSTTQLEVQWNNVPKTKQKPPGTLQLGNNVNITCVADALPSSTIEWSINNRSIPVGNSHYHVQGALLSINNLTRADHHAEIRCSSVNNVGLQLSKALLLPVEYGPKIVLSLSENIVTCTVDAFPVATVIIYENTTNQYKQVEDTAVEIHIEDCKHVTCNATNYVSAISFTSFVCENEQKPTYKPNPQTENSFKYMRPTQRKDLDW
ncbi:neural cell adhesion molecule L1.1-like isoform X2 [Anneissia japonica]|uniref:neural cell adhesion molecule L1.1-like isoform X2 n=1 Tax=Anneissia japonica TaxID=1529436 RepID=UPI001425949A|nr:neural cell adhesion molecule L1.1-like isoform X2 [Anneissia japonica]